MPGVPVRLRRLLGRDLLGGDEAESGRQRGFGQVAQFAPVELGPEAVVARGLLVHLVAVRGQSAQRVAVRGRDGDPAPDASASYQSRMSSSRCGESG